MGLLQQVMSALAVDEGKAERGIGAILVALRHAVDKDTFERVKQALPESESYMGRSLMSGTRTGDMAAAGPQGLMAGLAAAGFARDEIPRLGRIVLEHLGPAVGSANLDRFLAGAPALRG